MRLLIALLPLGSQHAVVHFVDALAARDAGLTQCAFLAHADFLHDAVRGEIARVGARADTRNLASHRVMEKVGMSKEGTLRQARVARGECIDEVHYGVLRPEWEERNQKAHG